MNSLSPENVNELCDAAIKVRQKAYAKYSKFLVGAAILDSNGVCHVGCNVENASYGLTICAERNAVFSAVSQGVQQFTAMAIATSGGHPPCGACRQVLSEFVDDLCILLCDADQTNSVEETRLSQLFPARFEFPK